MTSEIKASCAEFAANPVAGGVEWKKYSTIFSNGESIPTGFCTSISEVGISVYWNDKNDCILISCSKFNIESEELRFTDFYAAAEKAISLCRDRVEKMYQEFQKLEV